MQRGGEKWTSLGPLSHLSHELIVRQWQVSRKLEYTLGLDAFLMRPVWPSFSIYSDLRTLAHFKWVCMDGEIFIISPFQLYLPHPFLMSHIIRPYHRAYNLYVWICSRILFLDLIFKGFSRRVWGVRVFRDVRKLKGFKGVEWAK